MRRKWTAAIAAMLLGAIAVPRAVAQNYHVDWFTLDNGGVMGGSGATFGLSGTIGQPDAGIALSGGSYVVTGGFWVVDVPGCLVHVPADFDKDCDVDWHDLWVFEDCCVFGPDVPHPVFPGCGQADFDSDGDVDQSDFGLFQACYSGANRPANPGCAD